MPNILRYQTLQEEEQHLSHNSELKLLRIQQKSYSSMKNRSTDSKDPTLDFDVDGTKIYNDVSDKQQQMSSSCPLGKVGNLLCYLMAIVAVVLFCIFISLGKYEMHVYPIISFSPACYLLYTSSTFIDKGHSRSFNTLISRVFAPICQSARYNFLTNESSSKSAKSGIWRRCKERGDPNMNKVNILFILLPCLFYIIRSVGHRLATDGMDFSSSKDHGHIANAFGKLSAFAMSSFLVPVAKHSILLKSLDLDPRHGLRFHIFSGYIAMVSGLIHGLYWVLIWIVLEQDDFWSVFPTGECWTFDELLHGRKLHGDNYCHKRFVNLLGVFCGFCFLGLTFTSLWWVRRNHYRLFYICHVIFSILLLYGLAMHYNKMILYLAPSILYYFASSTPTWVQALKSRIHGGTRLTQVTHISDSRGCVEISFPMEPELNVNEGLCGRYVRLSAPKVSSVWHPFTVYTHPNDPNTLRLTFRSTGPFTKNLAEMLQLSKTSGIQHPKIIFDGLYGSEYQLSKACRHETVLIVAGGIGIVSYLSLIDSLRNVMVDEMNCEHNRISNIRTKHIILHWVCRDEGLIRYFTDQYFCFDHEEIGNIPFRVIIHHTNPTFETKSHIKNENLNNDELIEQGKLFVPSIFAGGKETWSKNLPSVCVFSLISWGGLWILRYFYKNVQQKEVVLTRSFTVTAIMMHALVASIICFIFLDSLPRACSARNRENDAAISNGLDLSSTKDAHLGKTCSSDTFGLGSEAQIEQNKIEHSTGRPDFSKITKDIVDTSEDDCAVVFVCGPSSLLRTIRECCKFTSTAVHEEIFEM